MLVIYCCIMNRLKPWSFQATTTVFVGSPGGQQLGPSWVVLILSPRVTRAPAAMWQLHRGWVVSAGLIHGWWLVRTQRTTWLQPATSGFFSRHLREAREGKPEACVPFNNAPSRPKPVAAKPRDKGQSGQNKAGQSGVWTQGRGCDHLDSVDFPNGERFLQAVVLSGMFSGQPVSSLPPWRARGRGLGVGSWERRVLEAEVRMGSSWQSHETPLHLQEQWVSGPPWAGVRAGDQG